MNKPIKRLNVKEKLLGVTVVLPEAYYCPKCNELLSLDKSDGWWTEKECPFCGTKIDWEDNDV
mgnify:FL=1